MPEIASSWRNIPAASWYDRQSGSFSSAVDVEVVTGAGVANVEVRHAPMDHVVADPTSASPAYAVRAG
jgi:hypothetical protein